MIDLNDLRARPTEYQTACDNKNITFSVTDFLKLDDERKAMVPQVEEMRAKQNEVSKVMPTLEGAEKEQALTEMKALKAQLVEVDEKLKAVEVNWKQRQLLLPSIPLASVPVGKDDNDNVENRTWGDPSAPLGKTPDFKLKDHVELGAMHDLFDIERGVKLAGSRSYFLKGDGARLHHAVMQYCLQHLTNKGWTQMNVPLMVNYEALMGTGFFPGSEDQTYSIGVEQEAGSFEHDGLYLIGTSEVCAAAYHSGETLKKDDLPKRYAGYSSCFRREAGTYGKDTHGLYRIHQFEKVEQVVICEADEEAALAMFEEIRNNAEEVLKALELPYRILDVCTGDMGKGKVVMQDIETWMPSRDSYGETHSCSYLGDFQARRLNLKYDDNGEKKFCHTLNNTCVASPRILIPILETYQNKDGTITVPEVLRPYMNDQKIISEMSS